MLARWSFVWIARDEGSQIFQVVELVDLSSEVVGDHRRRGFQRADRGDAHSLLLDNLHKPAKIAVARQQDDVIDRRCDAHHVDGEFHVHVAFQFAAPVHVGVFFGGLGDHAVAVVIQPVDQGTQRRELFFGVLFKNRRVVVGANQTTASAEKGEQLAVVDFEA